MVACLAAAAGCEAQQVRQVRDGAGWRNTERASVVYGEHGRIDKVTGDVFAKDGWQATQRHDYVHTDDADSSTFAAFRLQPLAPIVELMVWAYGEVHSSYAP